MCDLHTSYPTYLLSHIQSFEPAPTPLGRFALATLADAWDPTFHHAYPTAFKQAARTLLLINHRGLVVPAAAAGDGGKRRRRQAAAAGAGQRRRQQRAAASHGAIQLPQELLLRILGLAAQPAICWMPQLLPHLTEAERQQVHGLI